MGSGKAYKCSKCGKKYYALTGIGFMFPTVYENVMDDIKNGKYGQERKELASKEKNVAVDAERHLYVCGKCHHWSTEYGLSLYTLSEPEDLPYMADIKGAHILKRYTHKCEKCGAMMHKATKEEEISLPCPDCGGAPDMTYDNWICWD